MRYRDYGKTGLRPSALGFGAMRLPAREDGTCDYEAAVPLLRRGIDQGVNYIDSAWGYINGTSEVAVGKAIKPYPREQMILATKIPIQDLDGRTWRERLEIQLQRFDTDYIDILHMHGLGWEQFQQFGLGEEGCLKAAQQARSEGLIRNLAFSCHDTPENAIKLIETGEFQGMLVQYNFLDRHMEEPIRVANAHGLGTVVMGPVGGGRLSMWSPEQARNLMPAGVTSAADLAIRWVLANPTVSVALSGMNEMQHIDENVVSAGQAAPFSQAEMDAVDALMNKLNSLFDLYCTGCGYCMPCPNGVDIPGNFLLMNYYRVYGMHKLAQEQYARLASGQEAHVVGAAIKGLPASECVQCGECEPKCPQNLQIIEQLEEVARTLGAA
ncbi:MAG: aldo/keto reductase [Anaerolineae bacterium]